MIKYIKFNKASKVLLFTVAMTTLTVSSCNKYTELSPLASLSESTAFTTPQNIELVVNGVYRSAAVGEYGGTTGRGYPFGAAAIEQGEMRGEDMLNLQAFFDITYRALYDAGTANNVNHWEQLYALINQANILIDGVNKAAADGIISQDVADSYAGEGLFLRALSHHELLIHFSRPFADGNGSSPGVPYRTEPITSTASVEGGMAEGRGTVAEAYAKILLDLDEAEKKLPVNRAGELKISRVTAGAAIALKTRIKLHMGDYQGVITEGAKMGTSSASGEFVSEVGGYKLEADPQAPFVRSKANSESIFSIANSASANPGVNGALSNMMGPSALKGRDLIAVSPLLYNAPFWVDGDLRRTELLYHQAGGDFPLVFTLKYTDFGILGDWAPVIRYAEVLLNVAEAYARTGNTAQALSLLNSVRNRSVPEAARFAAAPADIIQSILDERRIEFFAEGRRWSDIHRLALSPYGTGGIPAKIFIEDIKDAAKANPKDFYQIGKVVKPTWAAIPYSDFRFLWPIPSSEINSNPTLRDQQNPNY